MIFIKDYQQFNMQKKIFLHLWKINTIDKTTWITPMYIKKTLFKLLSHSNTQLSKTDLILHSFAKYISKHWSGHLSNINDMNHE